MNAQQDHDDVIHSHDVFISYAHKDANQDVPNARLIGNWLENEGYDVWWDRSLLLGDVVQERLERKVQHAKRVIVLWSPRAAASEWVRRECELAAEGGKLAPIVIEDTPLLPDWEKFLWFKLTNFEAQKDELRRRLPPPSLKRGVAIAGLPAPARTFIGREDELARLRQAWASTAAGADPARKTNVSVLHAIGGAGKSALLQEFLRPLNGSQLPGAHTVYAWSAYSQGSGDNRTANADEFIAKALKFFGHDLEENPIRDDVERGRRLAQLVGERRALMILDGLEPLQDMAHINDGRLKDRGLAAFITTLARENKGLLLITSRQELPELAQAEAPRVISDPLDRMDMAEGVKLMAALGVDGKRTAMERAVEEVLGHALLLNLLGAYLDTVHGGDVNQREQFRLGEIEDAEADFVGDNTARYAKRAARIMEGTIARFEALEGRTTAGGEAETAILHMVGLFDRPAEAGALEALLDEPVIPGLTDAFHGLSMKQRKARWNVAVERLRKLKLLSGEDKHTPGGLDAHPIVRAHFGDRLKVRVPETYTQAHSRLYDYYRYQGLSEEFCTPEAYGLLALLAVQREHQDSIVRQITKERWTDSWLQEIPPSLIRPNWDKLQDAANQLGTTEFDTALKAFLPSSLENIHPLFSAVAHGCASGRHQEAYDEIYFPRLARGDARYVAKNLGAMSADLTVLAAFFVEPWTKPADTISKSAKAFILSFAAFLLNALGRLNEAAEALNVGIESSVTTLDWKGAARDTVVLSELYLCLGEVSESINVARNSVKYADKSDDMYRYQHSKNALADALHNNGQVHEAQALFTEAEMAQAARQPDFPKLYSLDGYRYCAFLLAQGQTQTVIERAKYAASVAKEHELALHALPLDHLSLGRAYTMLFCNSHSNGEDNYEQSAADYLNDAVEGLRRAAHDWLLAPGLLARAAFHRCQGAFSDAAIDLAEIYDIANRSKMRLHLTDYHLEAARLALAQLANGDTTLRAKAEDHVAKAADLIKATGYNRRLPELAAIRACLDGQIPAHILAPDRDEKGRPIWHDLAIPD